MGDDATDERIQMGDRRKDIELHYYVEERVRGYFTLFMWPGRNKRKVFHTLDFLRQHLDVSKCPVMWVDRPAWYKAEVLPMAQQVYDFNKEAWGERYMRKYDLELISWRGISNVYWPGRKHRFNKRLSKLTRRDVEILDKALEVQGKLGIDAMSYYDL